MKHLFPKVAFLAGMILLLGAPGVVSGGTHQLSSTTLVINEIDYDQVGADAAEYLELKNISGSSINLDAYEVRFINGSGGATYDTINLPNINLAANDYYVICANAATVPDCDLDDGPDTDFIQNGSPDGIVLAIGATIIDAVSYEGNTAGATEDTGTVAADSNSIAGIGLSRCPDGADTDNNNADFLLVGITPGATNNCPGVSNGTLRINEVDYDQPSGDTAEFVELKNTGVGPENLNNYTLELVNGNTGGAVVYVTIDLPDVNLVAGDYFVVCAETATVANCDLDVTPNTDLIQNGAPDAVGLRLSGVLIDAVSYEGNTGAPYTEDSGVGLIDAADPGEGISRCPDGVDTDVNNVDFLSNRPITPGATNDCIDDSVVVINEFDYDQIGTDAAEFVELKNVGPVVANLDNYTLELVNGNAGGAAVYQSYDLPNVILDAGDYYVICANNATVANCDLDVTPNTDLIQNGAPDAIGLRQLGVLVDAVSYEGDTLAPYTEGTGAGLDDSNSIADVGVSRCPDGVDTNANNADFDSFRPITPGATNDCPPPAVIREIFEIQGAGHASADDGNPVFTPDNIVTAVRNNGFWIQTPDARDDANDATSNGIFVFTSSAPTVAVGDQVDVLGTVSEFQAGAPADANLRLTELTGPTVTIDSSGNPLPTAVVIGIGGRVPPNSVIEDDSFGSYDIATDGIDFYESLEGMRVQVNEGLVVGATNGFGETWIVSDDGVNATILTARGGINIGPGDFNPERVQLDDDIYPGVWPQVNVGTQLTSPAIGVVGYSFGNFEVLVTNLFTIDTSSEVVREVTSLVGGADSLTIATFNVENLGGNAALADFASRADQIVNNLKSPDILVLEEIQDNNGTTNDGTVDATTTFNNLIAAIVTAGGPTYQFAQIDPANGQDGGAPGGNIRVGFLYNTARGITFNAQPGGDATTATTVTCTAGTPELSFNPGRIDPTNSAWTTSRKPLVGEFSYQGQSFFIIGVHFNSKGGDNPLFGNVQPPVFGSEVQRINQAQTVNDFIDTLLACDPDANIVTLGDLNDFHFSTPVATLAADVMDNLMDTLPPEERYSYVFDGNSQTLDQILVSHHITDAYAPVYDVVHINSEFQDQVSDHDPSVMRVSVGPTPVVIDVRPGSPRNVINIHSRGRVPVAILSNASFNAPAEVDPTTVFFAGAPVATQRNGDLWVKVRDVNRDHIPDLVLRFNIQDTDLAMGDTHATLVGELFDGTHITGTDNVTIKGRRPPETIESDDEDEVMINGIWTPQSSNKASGDSYLYSSGSASDTLELEFEGTRLDVVYVEGPAFGSFTIYIDNVAVRTVFTNRNNVRFDRRATINNLDPGPHTVEIVPSGVVAIDAFVVKQ